MNEADLREPDAGQTNGLGRRVDADALILLGQAGQIGSRAAADVDNRGLGRRGQDGADDRRQDLPSRHEPPMSLFDLGMELELGGVHGFRSNVKVTWLIAPEQRPSKT